MSVWRRLAPVRGALPSLHLDDGDDHSIERTWVSISVP